MVFATIVALATPVGEGGIGIIRLSGNQAKSIAAKIIQPLALNSFAEATSRCFYYGWVVDPEDGTRIDEVLAVWMQAPTTYTGEEVVEIQGHGGMVPLTGILRLCLREGAEPAEPGEFTKRAFFNGRIDLTQGEAVMDLIQARGEAAGRQALRQLQGALGARLKELSATLLQLLAMIEAWVDFSQEVGELDLHLLTTRWSGVQEDLNRFLREAEQGKVIRQGLTATIVGKPNVGKSSLLNALLGEERALVSEYAGTTRDMIEEQINIAGLTIILRDTAGLSQSRDPLEQLGVARSQLAITQTELLLIVLDGSAPLVSEEKELLLALEHKPGIVVVNKNDLPLGLDLAELKQLIPQETPLVFTAAPLAQGLTELRQAMASQVMPLTFSGESPLLTRQRHVFGVSQALEQLRQGEEGLAAGLPWDLIAIDLRAAWRALAEITGEVASGDIVEAIFRDFCIGK
ncbi:MAG: tRNA uridine-5-carboxymethylaminomethyl(34) synthesis GTPase MnmE [Symbiobacteriaceae bacterium]|nr:tRNA uridine-5-carboxymethylaminomethyl(34) synthesis GTPase MnmE [Symbiobacteriaceae bacterium]